MLKRLVDEATMKWAIEEAAKIAALPERPKSRPYEEFRRELKDDLLKDQP
jgi:hypothetical protein